MVAPVDATATIEAEGETFTLRLNFRAIALAEAEGIDLFDPQSLNKLTTASTSRLIRCLAKQDQDGFTDEQGFALATRHGEAVTLAIFQLIQIASGKGGDEPNPPKAGRKRATA